MNNSDEINYFFMNKYQNKIGIFVKLIWKVFMRRKNWSDFKGLHLMNLREEDWSKIKTLLMNSRQEFRNHRMKSIVWMIREILKMLEKTTCRQYFILSSLMSQRPSQVSPFLVAAHSTSSEVRSDFHHIWFSPGFLMQSRQARQDPSRCIARPNSSSASILLWLFLHLHLLAFFSTSLQDCWWRWNGWCWTNAKDDSIHHVWIFLSVCLRVGSWCQCIWFESWGPNWFYQTTNQEQLCGFWKHVSLWDFFPS